MQVFILRIKLLIEAVVCVLALIFFRYAKVPALVMFCFINKKSVALTKDTHFVSLGLGVICTLF